MNMRIKQFLLNTDIALGRFFILEQPLSAIDNNLTEKNGVYSAEEWKLTRSKGYNEIGIDAVEISTDMKYLKRMLTIEMRKLLAALSLVRHFNFGSYKSILEIGCGEMIQAYVIKQSYPQLRYLATDIDPYIVEKCSQLNCLRDIQKSVLNVKDLSTLDLREIDLMISWVVEYAIDRNALIDILKTARNFGVSYMVCTQQLIGPIRYIKRKYWSHRPERLKRLGVRMHGWTRSIAFFKKCAVEAGMQLQIIHQRSTQMGSQANYTCMLFMPAVTVCPLKNSM